jgi:hypothetical protein
LTKLADLDKAVLSYSVTGLSPGTDYKFSVDIDYTVKVPAGPYDVTQRCYTKIEAKTLLPATATPSATATSTPGGASQGFPIWAAALVLVGGLGVGAAVTVLIKKRPKA